MLTIVLVKGKKTQKICFKIFLLSLFLMLFFSPVMHLRAITTSSSLSEDQLTIPRENYSSSSVVLPNIAYNDYAKISDWDINYGRIWTVTVKDDIVFLGTHSGLLVLDVSNPAAPITKFFYELFNPYGVQSIFVTDNYAFVGSNEVYIFDISDINDIFFITKLNSFGMDLAVQDDCLYVADGFMGLTIFNISHIASPSLLKIHAASVHIGNIEINGDLAYIEKQTETYTNILIVLNVSDPTSPYQVGSYTRTDLYINKITFQDNYVYMACGNNGLLIIDVSNPTNPTLVGEYDDGDGGSATAIAVSGNHVYMAEGYECLEIISVATKSSPSQVGEYVELGEWMFIAFDGNTAYLGGQFYTNKLIIIDCSSVISPTKAGEFSIGGSATSIFVSDDFAYVSNLIDGLYIIDISDVLNPVKVGHFNDGLGAYEVCVVEDIAYIAAYFDGFKIVNCSDPTNPIKIAEYSLDDTRGIAIKDDCAYVVDQTYGLYIFNISDPTTPVLIATYDDDVGAQDVFINGNYLYLAYGSKGLYIIDITDPHNPVKLADYNNDEGCKDVYVSGNFAYLACYYSELVVLDVSNPLSPSKVYQTSGYDARGVFVIDDTLYLSAVREGVKIYDLTTPSSPSLIDTYYDGHYVMDSVIDGEYVFLAEDLGGLEILGEDSDDDNLADIAETGLYGTNPDDSDSDNDQLKDGDEVFNYNTDPLDSDTDDDNLSDYQEIATYLTDPTNDDTDRDGINDGEEVIAGADGYVTNPKDKDSDRDGLSDFEEVNTYYTDPTDMDTDDDGYTDYEEVQAGTDPLDPDSYPGAPTKKSSFGSIISLVIISFFVLFSIAFIQQKRILK